MKTDKAKLNAALLGRLDDLLDALGAPLNGGRCCCVIHGGDTHSGLSIDAESGKYTCWSRHCEQTFGRDLIGLVWGCLSRNNCMWAVDGDQRESYGAAIAWCLEFLEASPDQINKLEAVAPQRKVKQRADYKFTRARINQWLTIPSSFYIARGFTEETLRRYSIGDCHEWGRYYKRAVVPIYNDKDEAVAFTARSLLKKCSQCNLFHQGDCPITVYPSHSKWLHENLVSSKMLYNYYEQLNFLRESRCAIVVESPANALRLTDAGICGAVCTFGAKISEGQFELLAKASVDKVCVAFDSDQAGIEGAKRVAQKYGRDFNIIVPSLQLPPNKDIADFSNRIVHENFSQILRKYGCRL
jgi:5S rRNA maturation endonuclease (ribonuclease M5)